MPDIKLKMEAFLNRLNEEYEYDLGAPLASLPSPNSRKEQYAQLTYYNGKQAIEMLNSENAKMMRCMWNFAVAVDEMSDEELKHPKYDHPLRTLLTADIEKRKNTAKNYAHLEQSNRVTPDLKQSIEEKLDELFLKYPNRKITSLRQSASEELGLSVRSILRYTKYNPIKKDI